MKVIFEENTAIEKRVVKVVTHPEERSKWDRIEKAIGQSETQLTVIHAKNNRNVQIQLSSVVAIESEDRMCCVRVITGERYLLNKRLKFVEEDLDDVHFVKINNQTIINTRYITAFSATDHARIKVDLSDSSSYFVSRFYIKNFRGKLS
ncbi:LytTR family DNA-binding domain-containing protein [Paenibacillus sp. FSL H8-0317]|uniref:LytTR family DNA-binding domain-containing protein n=1 Tax=Paenibacillus sp. FSL H8-0317 TaxID=2921385 RepID=UPI003247143E